MDFFISSRIDLVVMPMPRMGPHCAAPSENCLASNHPTAHLKDVGSRSWVEGLRPAPVPTAILPWPDLSVDEDHWSEPRVGAGIREPATGLHGFAAGENCVL